jgi:hypothetical protein
LEENAIEQRLSALKARLRIEEFAFECLAVAAPYLNTEDKLGWKAYDALKFLRSEIDPKFLSGRKIALSMQVPDAEHPTPEDYELLEWSQSTAEPDLNLNILRKHWNSMGELLHFNLNGAGFDLIKARKRIEAANSFCDSLTIDLLVVDTPIKVVVNSCQNGHFTKRNANRLKIDQIIPCVDHQCESVFIVKDIEPLSWPEFRLQINCRACGETNFYQPKELLRLSYWEKAFVSCLSKDCDFETEVRWVLSRSTN